jgi:hypothetical protein
MLEDLEEELKRPMIFEIGWYRTDVVAVRGEAKRGSLVRVIVVVVMDVLRSLAKLWLNLMRGEVR